MKRYLKPILFAALIATVCLLAWQGWQFAAFVRQPLLLNTNTARTVDFVSGESLRQFAKRLAKQDIISSAFYFEWLARLQGIGHTLKAGEYAITPGMSVLQLLQDLQTGAVVQHTITFVEGWTLQMMLNALAQNPFVHHTLQAATPAMIAQQLHLSTASPEGCLFPDTYQFPKGTRDLELLKQASEKMQERLASLWPARAVGLPYQTPYQALIAASLIERETALPNERPLIAGVLVKRLEKKMPLQIDAAVIYGLEPGFRLPLTKADLRKKTPYNTYLQHGLPPTPIAMPGEASIEAALHPQLGTALYFVARGDGSHVFSDNLRAHNRAVKRYIQYRRRQEK